jgi:glutamate/tyrosine decarboxylase-like PLP-dependent enzyme
LSALGAKPLCFFISEEAHYSFEKAANVLGIGTDHVIAVAADSQGRMSPLALEREIEASKQMGLIPFFVGATSGTTVKAAFDPLLEISRVCKKHQVWLHVDAALGGSLLFSQKNRHMLEGIECADSVVWDAHKLMNVPLVASILLFKNTEDLLFSNSGGGEQYLFHEASSSMQSNESSNSRYDSGVASLQCGRRGDVFKIFYAWFMKGEKAWEEQIDAHIARTFRFESRLLQDSRFELISPAQSLSLCFRVKLASSQHEKAAPLDDQLYLRKQVLNAGKYMVNYSVDESNRPFFRLVALNNLVNDSDYENFFNHLLELAGYNEPLFEGKNLPI